ncbi:phosphoenolpyruvate--protein phosphotransferase [bacterium]|nr:phosphoenolpyruvate--protein phosphotransferase [bacterium]
MFPGRSAAPGIAIGKAFRVQHTSNTARQTENISASSVHEEQAKLDSAVERARLELREIINSTKKSLGQDESAIFEAHLMILEDPEFVAHARASIENQLLSAQSALQTRTEYFISTFEAMDSEYMRARAADVKDIGQRLQNHLSGQACIDLSNFSEDVVIVADELSPSEVSNLDTKFVRGLITEQGGRTSHVTIIARTLEIPMIVGAKDIVSKVSDGDLIVFDGEVGEAFVRPDAELLTKFVSQKKQVDALHFENKALIGEASITLDGRKVVLAGNIGTPRDLVVLKRHDAEGVGLFRTEFLFMDRASMPSENEQFEAYKEVLQGCMPHMVVIRTMDIGGDKELSYLKIEKEDNPFLGVRGIRLCLQNKPIFKTQLRAILRASHYGKLGIMFPMVSSLEELLEAKALLEEVRIELLKENVPVAKHLQVGVMIEVPAAALISDTLAKHCDFFSIGTNDLIQYCCAVDRMNKTLVPLYSPYHPGVLRLVYQVIQSAKKEQIWVGVCGEIAGNPNLALLLLGMGLDEFSMSPASILPIRKLFRSCSYSHLQSWVKEILELQSASQIEHRLTELLKTAHV